MCVWKSHRHGGGSDNKRGCGKRLKEKGHESEWRRRKTRSMTLTAELIVGGFDGDGGEMMGWSEMEE